MTQKAVTPNAWKIPAHEGFFGDMASVTAKPATDAAIMPAMIHQHHRPPQAAPRLPSSSGES